MIAGTLFTSSLIMTLEDDLTTAAATGNTATVEYLLENTEANVNGVNRFGRTALQVMMMGSLPVAQLLLKYGADPNVRDRSTGATPLHDAVRTGFVDTAHLLVQYHADPNIKDNMNLRPIDLAKIGGQAEVFAFLDTL